MSTAEGPVRSARPWTQLGQSWGARLCLIVKSGKRARSVTVRQRGFQQIERPGGFAGPLRDVEFFRKPERVRRARDEAPDAWTRQGRRADGCAWDHACGRPERGHAREVRWESLHPWAGTHL